MQNIIRLNIFIQKMKQNLIFKYPMKTYFKKGS